MDVLRSEVKRKNNRPAVFEFSKETILLALRNCEFTCQECGIRKKDTPEGYLEAHHIVPIFFVLKYFPQLSAKAVSSLANCRILCCECHDRLHSENNYHEFQQHAQALLSIASIDVRTALGAGKVRRIS